MRNSKKDEQMRNCGYLPVTEVAELACIHQTTLYRAIKEGKLKATGAPGVKYLAAVDVAEWLDALSKSVFLAELAKRGITV